MKEGANPEMDGLKKLVTGRLQAEVVGQHPDADVLTAFAENALYDAERAQVLQHLGACNDCRETVYLAAENSPEAQKVLSFQPKLRWRLFYRWGALAASVVIVAGAIIARYPRLHQSLRSQAPASPALESYSKLAQEKVPAEEQKLSDRLAPVPQRAKERPEAKHMTAKPQAGMEFDETDQVRVTDAPAANEKKTEQNSQLTSRNAFGLPAVAAPKPVAQPLASPPAKDKNLSGTTVAYADQSAQQQGIRRGSGAIDGTIVDPSGAVVGNAKVTTLGPAGSQTVLSDSQGNFVFRSLPTGSYSVKAEATGFKSSEINNVAVLDNKQASIGLKLELGNTAEAVEVSAGTPAVNEVSVAAAAPPPQVLNGLPVLGEAESTVLQKAVATNSRQAAKARVPRWTISAEGALERSLDGGKTWQKVLIADGAVFRALSILGAHIWVGGKQAALYHSEDSGQTWTKVTPIAGDTKLNLDISHVEFSEPTKGTVSTTNGEVWTTSDGGRTWLRK